MRSTDAAAGYGLDLALGCDLRVMSATASSCPASPSAASSPRAAARGICPRLVGWAQACEIGFLGDDLDAERALALGLVNAVVPAEQLTAAVDAVGRTHRRPTRRSPSAP